MFGEKKKKKWLNFSELANIFDVYEYVHTVVRLLTFCITAWMHRVPLDSNDGHVKTILAKCVIISFFNRILWIVIQYIILWRFLINEIIK